jgi:3-hydroxyisobutyrate dehydrogenase
MANATNQTPAKRLGWIGLGRMGFPMAGRLLKAGHDVSVWNRTRAKAEPLTEYGAKIVDKPADLAGCDVVLTMVSTGKDLKAVCLGPDGLLGGGGKRPAIVVDCSSISLEESAEVRAGLAAQGVAFVCAPVSGNGKCVKAGKLSAVMSGPRGACDQVKGYVEAMAPRGVAYVGEGELARVCKIAHNVMLAVVIENLIEITLLAEKAGVPRAAFLDFMNDSVMGSVFTRYKTNGLVNLDFTTTFTPELLLKDIDLGLDLAKKVKTWMPVTQATRGVVESHFGVATLQADPAAYLEKDFTALIETMALASGMKLVSENTPVPTGLEVPH